MKILSAIILITFLAFSRAENRQQPMNVWEGLIVGTWNIIEALFYDLVHSYSEIELDAYKSDAEMYQSLGYRFEIHKILTPDNYILSAWRVPGKLSEPMSTINNKEPIMLQHGLLDNSATWTVNYFNQTLVYRLLEEGYDVWLTNTRGNFNSYEHTNPKDFSVFNGHSKYWNFTLDDMARYDLPTNIDYILDYTSREKLTYVGHSQGTFQFFAANSMMDLASKINKFVGAGPVMYAHHAKSPAAFLAYHIKMFNIIKMFNEDNILLWPRLLGAALNSFTNDIRLTVWRIIQFI